jgi:hypothetical protein
VERNTAYATALVIGLLFVFYLLPLPVIAGTGGLWVRPFNVDLAQNLTGHLVFQRPGWHWPLFYSPDLFWPRGASIAMTDSNPLVSLIAKLAAGLLGHPVNLFGVWFAACWLLQPVAAVYAVRSFGARRWEAAVAAAIFAACFPALLFRVGHINLCGHFVLLFGLGQCVRMIRNQAGATTRDWITAYVVLLVAIMIHPTLFLIDAAIFAAVPIQAVFDKRMRGHTILRFAASVILAYLPFQVLSGMTGGMDRGFGYYSMNLLSPVWPQHSGLFGAQLPTIDATGGQYEGFNYLGAGSLLLIALAGLALWRYRQTNWRRWQGLIVVLAGLTLLALSTQVYAGQRLLLPLGTRQWDSIFGFVRSSGRLFWPVGYALLLGAIAVISDRLLRVGASAVLLAAVILQLVDMAPLVAAARTYFARGGQTVASLPLPAGVGLLTTLPVCTHTDQAQTIAGLMRLDAARAGARLSDVKLSRLPAWFNCERALTDGTELPLREGEVRALLEPVAIERLREGILGPGASCRRYGGPVLCARDVQLTGGDPIEALPALPILAAGQALSGPEIAPILAFGWHEDPTGFLSEGPRATLLAKVAAPQGAILHMTLAGIARKAGGDRPISIQVGSGQPVDITLADLKSTDIAVPVAASDIADGVLRVAFDIFRPVDPAHRGLALPVSRAGIRIERIELSSAAG